MLVVEDGSIVAGATSYTSLEGADGYLSARGIWVPAHEGEQEILRREQCLVRAFDWLNSLSWLGEPVHWQQAAAWPRRNVPIPGRPGEHMEMSLIPEAVIRAQYEVAALIYGGLDMFRPLERGGKIAGESHSRSEGGIDVIGGDSRSDSYSYSESAPTGTFYPAVMGLIGPFLAIVPGLDTGTRIMRAERG